MLVLLEGHTGKPIKSSNKNSIIGTHRCIETKQNILFEGYLFEKFCYAFSYRYKIRYYVLETDGKLSFYISEEMKCLDRSKSTKKIRPHLVHIKKIVGDLHQMGFMFHNGETKAVCAILENDRELWISAAERIL